MLRICLLQEFHYFRHYTEGLSKWKPEGVPLPKSEKGFQLGQKEKTICMKRGMRKRVQAAKKQK